MTTEEIQNIIDGLGTIPERDIHILKHVLEGRSTRSVVWQDKAVNPRSVDLVKKKYIPHISFSVTMTKKAKQPQKRVITKSSEVEPVEPKEPKEPREKMVSEKAMREIAESNAATTEALVINFGKEVGEKLKLISDLMGKIDALEKAKILEETERTKLVSLIAEKDIELARLRDLFPKTEKREFYLQGFVSFGWLIGLIAMSVFSIENMIIFFNAGSYYIVAFVLGAFIEFMLWATNIAKYVTDKKDTLTIANSSELSIAIAVFRGVANILGGYYISMNAKALAQEGGLYASAAVKFTNIAKLYLGFETETHNVGMVITSVLIGGFVAYVEWRALPIAIKHAYNLFIKK